MKVLHVIPSVGPLRGGPSEILRTITSSLASAGVKVEVVTTDDNGKGRLNIPFTEAIFEEVVTHLYCPRQSRFYTFWLQGKGIDRPRAGEVSVSYTFLKDCFREGNIQPT